MFRKENRQLDRVEAAKYVAKAAAWFASWPCRSDLVSNESFIPSEVRESESGRLPQSPASQASLHRCTAPVAYSLQWVDVADLRLRDEARIARFFTRKQCSSRDPSSKISIRIEQHRPAGRRIRWAWNFSPDGRCTRLGKNRVFAFGSAMMGWKSSALSGHRSLWETQASSHYFHDFPEDGWRQMFPDLVDQKLLP